MGIPSYFSYVLKNHKIIKKLIGIKSNYLFMDANSIIYDVIHENQSSEIYENVYKKIILFDLFY
jgi:5'-3' exonuclease